MFFVVDTNVVVSALLFPGSLPSQVMNKILKQYRLAVSSQLHTEYLEVFSRKKFDPYVSLQQRLMLLDRLILRSEIFVAKEEIEVCRDPKDNKFLELAVSAKAACVVSGDIHLLELHPFQGIPILNAADFLKSF